MIYVLTDGEIRKALTAAIMEKTCLTSADKDDYWFECKAGEYDKDTLDCRDIHALEFHYSDGD